MPYGETIGSDAQTSRRTYDLC